ncbi:EamA family transporter [Propionivibrio sp.]|uniref:EamA family transporter n=1 Tax=Propionivibrio sp. TaxID=2212460 RepID=UPI0039E7086F
MARLTVKSALVLGYLVLNSSIAYTLWSVLLKYNRVGMVSVFNFLVPIFGAILSALFLGETFLEWKNLAALALVCSGIWLVTLEK